MLEKIEKFYNKNQFIILLILIIINLLIIFNIDKLEKYIGKDIIQYFLALLAGISAIIYKILKTYKNKILKTYKNKILSYYFYLKNSLTKIFDKKFLYFIYNIILLFSIIIYIFIILYYLNFIFNILSILKLDSNIKDKISLFYNYEIFGIKFLFLAPILIFLRYIKNIYLFLNKILSNYKLLFFIFGLFIFYIYLKNLIPNNENIFLFVFTFIGSLYFLYFILVFFFSKLVSYLYFEGEKGLYKKAYLDLQKSGKLNYKNFEEKIIELNKNINFIKLISDEPIGIGKDILQNKSFSENIYSLVKGLNFNEINKSYSIGIVGEWGQGKSSIIKLLDEYYLYGDNNFQILKFNPWDFKKENLINNFFSELSKLVGIKDLSKLFKNYLSLIGNIDSKLKIGIDFLNGFIGEKSLEEIKKEIDENLKDNGRKIVIIIDDLDRCEPDEILMMLNLIKNLGDFNNIIYLVSYDKEHIIKVLEDKKFSGDYIEKIINIERFIPVPGKEQLKEYFSEKFSEILKKLKKDDKNILNEKEIIEIIEKLFLGNETDLGEYDELFEKENLRFLKKLLNQLNTILQLNIYKNSKKLGEEEFIKIILINYIKLKDFKWFNYMLNLAKKIDVETEYNKPNRPKELLKLNEKYLYERFMKNVLLLNYSKDFNKNGKQIFNEDVLVIKDENPTNLYINNPNKYFIENFS